MSHTIERLHITVGGATHALGPLETVDDLKREITRTVREGGGFVDVSVDGGERLSVFFASTTAVTITAETVFVTSDDTDQGARREFPPPFPPGDIDPCGGYIDLI